MIFFFPPFYFFLLIELFCYSLNHFFRKIIECSFLASVRLTSSFSVTASSFTIRKTGYFPNLPINDGKAFSSRNIKEEKGRPKAFSFINVCEKLLLIEL